MALQSIEKASRVTEVLNIASRFSANERLILARLLLDSILTDESHDEVDWQHMSLASFQKDWDNTDDAVYDNWRELYGVQEG